jgi:hypothetical protein
MLQNNFGFHFPQQNAMLGSGLDTVQEFRNVKQIYFMEKNRIIVDMLWNNYYISQKKLYKIPNDIDSIFETDNREVADTMLTLLSLFNKINDYVYKNDKLYPVKNYKKETTKR